MGEEDCAQHDQLHKELPLLNIHNIKCRGNHLTERDIDGWKARNSCFS